jgi:PAS domain S-box-containing protein
LFVVNLSKMRGGIGSNEDGYRASMGPAAWKAMHFGFAFILIICGTLAPRADDTKRVLILNSAQSALPAVIISENSVRQELQDQLRGRVEFFSEFLDAERFSKPERDDRMASFLEDKYAGHPIDLLIVTAAPALNLILQRRAWLFPDTPVVFSRIRQESELLAKLPPGVTGITSRLNPVPTAELALRLQPDAQHLVVVTGTSDVDREWEQAARRSLHPYEDKLQVNYLAGLPMAELLRQLRELPSKTIVLYLSVARDGAGQNFLPRDVAKQVAEAANAPVYAVYDTFMGLGIVGGYMETFQAVGREVGRLGLRVLAGEKPETLPPKLSESAVNYVDWQQLQRWGLEKSRLPPGSVVRFKEPSPWKEYKWQIATAVGLIIGQAILISALLWQAQRRRRAELAVRDSEERMNLATTSANLGLWHWDSGSNRVWASEICRRILGLGSRAELALETILRLVHREDLVAAAASPARQASDGEPDEKEHHLLRSDGSERWVRAIGRTKLDASGRPMQMTGVVIDVTQERAAEREATNLRQELTHLTRVATLGELSGAMAHELNQPLTAILSNAAAAKLSLNDQDTDARDILTDIETEAVRAGNIIRHLRTLFAKSEAQMHPLDLNEVVPEVLKLIHSDLVTRRINVSTRLAMELPRVQGNRVQLQQVLLNLIFNACDAMAENEPGERDLTIVTALDGRSTALISIADRGAGIKPDLLDQLFKPFVTTKSRGLGIGLSICRSIVEGHGGRLWAINNSERGAIFCIALPAAGATLQWSATNGP